MRVNLRCPYNEKDEAKALGAKWDPVGKVWYVIYQEDLSRFARWLGGDVKKFYSNSNAPKKVNLEKKWPITIGNNYKPLCNCKAPPWEHCEHSIEALSMQ